MKPKLLITSALLFVLISSCSKEVGQCDLTEAQKQFLPYTKSQIISYLDRSGTPFDVTVTESEISWQKQHDGEPLVFSENHVKYRVRSAKLVSESRSLDIYMEVYADDCLEGRDHGYSVSPAGYNTFLISVGYPNFGRAFFNFSLDADANVMPKVYEKMYITSHDSLKINEKMYFNVLEHYSDSNSYYEQEIGSLQLFYNKTYGILQINRNGKNVLTLNN